MDSAENNGHIYLAHIGVRNAISQASAAVELNSFVFWVITRRRVFETDVSALPIGLSSRVKLSSWTA